MADYKRMVSYMYLYENGIKKKNVGYARIEAKNGQCKITLHMQLLGQLDSIFPTYLILRDGNNLDIIYLGDTVLKNQVMDSKLYANEANIMNSGHSLSEMGGMLLFLNENVFIATEWDDKPIVAREVLEALRPKKQKDFVRRNETPEIKPSTSNYRTGHVVEQAPNTAYEKASNGQKHEYAKEESYNREGSKSGILSEAKAKGEDTGYHQEIPEENKELVLTEKTEKRDLKSSDTVQEVFDYYAAQKLSLEEELKIPKYKLPRGWKTIERLHRTPVKEISMAEHEPEVVAYSPEAMQASAENQHDSHKLEIQQNLFGELLEQLQESGVLDESTSQREEKGLDNQLGNEDIPPIDKGNNHILRENHQEESSQKEEMPLVTSPLTMPDDSGEAVPEQEASWDQERSTDQEGALKEAPSKKLEEAMPPQMPESTVMPGAPMEESSPMDGEVTDTQGQTEERVSVPTEEQEHPTAKHFFDNFPRIYPFEDNEIIFCVKIEPKDIGMLPKEVWPLSNNSFLMHGFYCYHHLIFAKLKNRYGTYYILGIPGIYHNRERFMARMFGFENFKSIRKRDLRQGDFGYWYLPIQL